MSNVGYATLSVIPSFKGFRGAVDRGTSSAMSQAGRSAGNNFSSAFKRSVGAIGGLTAVFGVASFIKDSVELEAAYSKTMAQMRVATQAPAEELKRLDDLAIRLGKETVFSAVDASDAMLELAKNGIKPATIEAGALESALTLAAAGGVELDQAAGTMGNTLNAFRLKGKQSASVAAALAGAANASSASVGSLAEGLQQASTVAADTGFNVQETTGILAAFANAGIDGSDAGTSLKTMLSRLVPTTAKAAGAMEKYGLKFTTANGEFKSAVDIAADLKEGLGDLSAEERSAALNTIFGSDARRAATILVKEGADGLAKYIKATSDQGAAEEMAQANMEGTAGAIERLKGAWETAKLEFGKEIAPVAADFLDFLSEKVDDVAPKLVEFGDWFQDEGVPKLKKFAGFVEDDVLPALEHVGGFAKDAAGFVADLAGAFDKMPKAAKLTALTALLTGGAALKLRGGGGGLLGTAGKVAGLTRPVPVLVTNPGSLGGGLGLGGLGGEGGKGGKFALGRGVLKATVVGGVALYATDLYVKRIRTAQGYTNNNSKDATDPDSVFADPRRRLSSDKLAVYLDATEKKAQGLGRELDLVGGKKVEPKFAVPGLAKSQDGLREFLRLQINAGKPITPYINTTSIERAIAQARTLNAELAGHSVPTAGTDNGVGFQHGSTGLTPRGIVNNFYGGINGSTIPDVIKSAERSSQRRGHGGFGGPN